MLSLSEISFMPLFEFEFSLYISGDVLGVNHVRTWEFNSMSPVRSIALPYVLCGGPLWIVKIVYAWTGRPLLNSQVAVHF